MDGGEAPPPAPGPPTTRSRIDSARTPGTRRLLVVARADPRGRYEWLPPPRGGDVVVTLDGLAHADLAAREPIGFDELESWEERDATERRVGELLGALQSDAAVRVPEQGGYRLIDLASLRLQRELVQLLRGWTLAGAAPGAGELLYDPDAPPALVIGARAGLGLDPASVPYRIPAALPGSRWLRALARPPMAALAAVSRPARVRVAAVVAGKLMLALDSLTDVELRQLGVGVMPFPGIDHGNGAVLALRRRLPLLATFGPRRPGPGPGVRLPAQLEIGEDPRLQRALTVLVKRMLQGVAPELDGIVEALSRLERARSLHALLLPSAAYGASRILIEWAHRRGLPVGVMQHGIYAFREAHGEDQLADMVFSWGEGTAEQIHDWPHPRPLLQRAGVPGTPPAPRRAPPVRLRRALIATGYAIETPIAPVTFVELFVEALAPGLCMLRDAGVELALRTHPNEDPARYRRLFAPHGLDIPLAPGGLFAEVAPLMDISIVCASSVAFEAGALGLPVLLWMGSAPRWVRENHLVAPWTDDAPGMFSAPADFTALAEGLLARPAEALAQAQRLGRRLARYAQPFDSAAFAEGVERLAED
jgi:hypothetical protein